MDLDADCLRWARVENLERLARALRVPLPPDWLTPEARKRGLARAIVTALDDGAQQPVRETIR